MENLRTYGKKPYNIAVIHGGPGAAGEMAPVARELSFNRGVLEPLQTKSSIEGQVQELKIVLEENGSLPITLIGFSWGAWLGFIFTANYPASVKKLILVSSGPFMQKYATKIKETRMSRLSEEERTDMKYGIMILNDPTVEDKNSATMLFKVLYTKADTYDPIMKESEELDFRFDIFQKVWKEADELRRSGKLLELGKQIQCPVVAIHGDYDPHPAEGVQKPLSAIIKDFRFILLEKCGHKPWIERQAKNEFYAVLEKELG